MLATSLISPAALALKISELQNTLRRPKNIVCIEINWSAPATCETNDSRGRKAAYGGKTLIAPESFREPVRPHQPETDRGDS